MPKSMQLGPWCLDPNMPMPNTHTRRTAGPGSELIIQIVLASGWKVYLPFGKDDLVQGSFAAPEVWIAKLYADDYLYRQGYSGEDIAPLPTEFPPLRARISLVEGAECACGYIGEDICDRSEPCPGCGGVSVLSTYDLQRFLYPLADDVQREFANILLDSGTVKVDPGSNGVGTMYVTVPEVHSPAYNWFKGDSRWTQLNRAALPANDPLARIIAPPCWYRKVRTT